MQPVLCSIIANHYIAHDDVSDLLALPAAANVKKKKVHDYAYTTQTTDEVLSTIADAYCSVKYA